MQSSSRSGCNSSRCALPFTATLGPLARPMYTSWTVFLMTTHDVYLAARAPRAAYLACNLLLATRCPNLKSTQVLFLCVHHFPASVRSLFGSLFLLLLILMQDKRSCLCFVSRPFIRSVGCYDCAVIINDGHEQNLQVINSRESRREQQ